MHDSVIVECRFDLIRSCCPEVGLGRLRALRFAWPFETRVLAYSHVMLAYCMSDSHGDGL